MNEDRNNKGLAARLDHGEALGRLTELARQELPPPSLAHESAAAYDRFTLAVRRTREASQRLVPGWLGVLVAASVVALLTVGAWRLTLSPPLSVTIAGGTVDEGGFVRAGAAGEPSMRFSDGSEINLAPLSRARVAETTRNGARVTLEDGRAQARVVSRKGASWVFDAGPCRVQVTGTRFEMRWSAPEQVLEVRLYSGGVTVKGPPATAGVPMRAGQRLVMDVRQGSVRLTDLASPGRAANDNGVAPAVVDTASPATEGGPTSAVLAAPAAPAANEATAGAAAVGPGRGVGVGAVGVGARAGEPWTDRVLAGEFQAVIDEAKRRGIEDVLWRDSAANIMALADAARYAGASSLAEKALLRVRSRFPRTPAFHKAAFLLGRIAEDQRGNPARALEWYERYLADAPDDAYRAEAMGRRMTATLGLSGATQARDLAADYLRRYPRGAYAKAAQAILSP